MNNNDYEQAIKNLIIKEYGSLINKEKLSLLNEKKYPFNSKEGLVKSIFSDLLDTIVKRQVEFNNDIITTNYGEELKFVFINYLMYKLNIKYNLELLINERYLLTFQFFDSLDQYYPNFIEGMIFKKNALELEQDQILSHIVKYYNNNDAYLYTTKLNYLKTKEENFEQVNISEYLNNKINYYQGLVNKYAKGEELTLDEMKELQNNISSNTGYTLKSFALYVVMLTLLIVGIFLALILM